MGTPSGSFWIGAINAVTPINGRVQEFVLWDNDQSANRTDIEADISAYWTANKRVLDSYPGATFGGAVRRLDNDYTGSCMRIRRSSDNTEQDIGFDSSGNLDTAAIETFCTTSTGWVTKLYDQSGSGNDAYQTITSVQPQIYDGSKVLVYNGRPSMRATTASTYLRWTGVLITGTGARSMLVVANPDSALNDNVLALTSSGSGNGTTWNWTTEVAVRVLGAQVFGNNGMSTQTVGMLTFPSGGQIADIDYYENSVQATPTSTTASVSINTASTGYSFMHATEGWMHECLMWESDQTSNQSDIYTEVEGYYQTQTQLLIDTYEGAAAAYSVRKLSQWYTGSCMRIREDSDNTETDIGFDSNGDLDTAAIASHCGSANGYVVTWYDQSGNGQDVTQATAANQPQIYNGTAVLTDNGKPCVEFDGSNDLLTATNTAFSGTNQSMFLVNNADATSGNPFRAMVCIGPSPIAGYKMRILTHGPDIQFDVVFNSVTWSGSPGSQNLLALIPDGGATTVLDYDLYQDGSLLTPTATNQTQNLQDCSGGLIKLGYNFPSTPGSSQYHFDGKLQEVILYNDDQSANRTGFESNINTYFSIYP